MQGRPSSSRRSFASLFTLVTVIFLSLLLATKTILPNNTIITRLPTPRRSNSVAVSEVIRTGRNDTVTVAVEPVGSSQEDGHSQKDTASSEEEQGRTSYSMTAREMKKPRKYYMGLSCPRREPKPGVKLPKITLASFPRAGNGWTRQLIQYATGLYVGADGWVGRRKHNNLDDFPATGEDIAKNRVVIIKTHDTPKPGPAGDVVLLIRNPYQSFVSHVYKRIFKRENFSKKGMLDFFKTDKWVEEVTRMAKEWTLIATKWINQSKRLLLVSNERLFNNTEGELARIIEFLHQPINKDRLQCAVKAYYPQASSPRFGVDPYTDELRTLIDSCVEEVNRTLIERRLSTLPTYVHISEY